MKPSIANLWVATLLACTHFSNILLPRLSHWRLKMTRYFNAKAEFSLTDDKLQKKFFKALQGGDSDGIKLTVEKIEVSKDVYFEMSGWDLESGNPSADLFAELGIE